MITCEEARPDQIPGIFRVRLAVVENALTEGQLAELGITPESFEAELGQRYHAWVIEEDGQVVGFSVADIQTSSIWALFVRPEHEGRGFGSRLLDRAVARLWNRGATRIWLKTDADSRAAGFYRRSGWRESGAIDNGEITFELEYRVSTDFE